MMQVKIEFTIRGTPNRRLVRRKLQGVPRVGELIEMSQVGDTAEVRTVTWETSGEVYVQAVSSSTAAELPSA